MKVATFFTLFLASASAFTSPQFATRAVGKPAPKVVAKAAVPAKKVVVVAKKAAPVKAVVVAKKAAPVKVVAKAAPVKAVAKPVVKKAAPVVKAVAKKVVAKVVAKKVLVKKVVAKVVAKKSLKPRKAPPASQGYPSFAAGAQAFRLGKFSGGAAGKIISPVFIHPTVNTAPPPNFDYKLAAKSRLTKNAVFVYDDGLTILERKQRSSIPAFLTGSAKSSKILSEKRTDIEEQEYPFGLSGDNFQLLFITVFGLFTLVGCLSGSIQLD